MNDHQGGAGGNGGAPAQDATPRLVVGLRRLGGRHPGFPGVLRALPADSGIGYVVVLHLSPEHESHLAEVLQVSADPGGAGPRRSGSNRTGLRDPAARSLAMSDGH